MRGAQNGVFPVEPEGDQIELSRASFGAEVLVSAHVFARTGGRWEPVPQFDHLPARLGLRPIGPAGALDMNVIRYEIPDGEGRETGEARDTGWLVGSVDEPERL